MGSRDVLFKRINNALFDMQAATSQTFEQHFLTFARLLADSSLQHLNQKLTAELDVDEFLEVSSRSQGSMMGSARLAWPEGADEVLGLQWLLIQKFAREPRGLLSFAHTYYTVGRNLTDELHSLTRQLLIPFARDYKDHVMAVEQPEELTSMGSTGGGTAYQPTQITYQINGNNARVNLQSVDNSVNSVVISSTVINYIRDLRAEVQRAPLSEEQRASAMEVVDEVESQIVSGKPKRAILAPLLASLPAIDSITSIVSNLLEALTTIGAT
ncbi:hypothetical protein [Hydrogenophaga intermedia]|uniref:hypothetical protein n=1 Tax=Hydrogenophaga intermedia TaxID=65786 RepID=UPI0020432588|nr:hypothetical protein [Hydrogenophaga intermedia]MCM3562675.1 hypothetical protein [Hydrogenophaga intermedia]